MGSSLQGQDGVEVTPLSCMKQAHAEPMMPTNLEEEDFVVLGNVKEHSEVCLCAGDAGLHWAPGVPLRHFLAGKKNDLREHVLLAIKSQADCEKRGQHTWMRVTYKEAHPTVVIGQKVSLHMCQYVRIKHGCPS